MILSHHSLLSTIRACVPTQENQLLNDSSFHHWTLRHKLANKGARGVLLRKPIRLQPWRKKHFRGATLLLKATRLCHNAGEPICWRRITTGNKIAAVSVSGLARCSCFTTDTERRRQCSANSVFFSFFFCGCGIAPQGTDNCNVSVRTCYFCIMCDVSWMPVDGCSNRWVTS